MKEEIYALFHRTEDIIVYKTNGEVMEGRYRDVSGCFMSMAHPVDCRWHTGFDLCMVAKITSKNRNVVWKGPFYDQHYDREGNRIIQI